MKIPKAVVKLRYHCFYQNNKYNMINKHRKGSNLFVVPLLLEPVCLATVCALRWPNGASCESESYGCLICFKFSLLTKLFHIIIIFGLVFRFCKKSLQLKLCFQAEKKNLSGSAILKQMRWFLVVLSRITLLRARIYTKIIRFVMPEARYHKNRVHHLHEEGSFITC